MKRRDRWLVAAALAAGLAIAFIDSRPTWDDTAITVGALFTVSAALSAVASRRPWLWGLLVGMWIPIFEIRPGLPAAPLAALAFAIVGSVLGWVVAQFLRGPAATVGPPSGGAENGPDGGQE
jgi:hypothetical protein